jgi:O-antigen/teichoic acid export membrane protein
MGVSKQLKRLGKDSLFYGLGSALQRFIGFFLFPIYTRVLAQADFGAQDLVSTAITITSTFLVLGLDSGTARHYYDAETSADRKQILSTWLWFELFISIPVCILLIVFAQPICALIFNDSTLAPFFRLGMATLPFTLLAGVTSLTLRLTFQSKKFSIISTAGVLVQALAAIYLVAILRMGVAGVFLANMIANVFRAGLGVGFTRKHFRLIFSKSWLQPMLAFGLPLVPASLSLWILNYSNRYFLVRLATLSDVGLLAVGIRISSIVTFVISAFQIAWGPFAYSLIKDERLAKGTYSKVLTYFLLISSLATVSLAIFAREAVLVLATPAYEPSASLVPWLCYGSIAWGAVYIVGIGSGIARKSYHTTIATVLAALVNTGLNFLLIPRWGITGAAASTMLGYLMALIYRYYVGQHYFPVNYEFRRVFMLVGMATVTIAAGVFIDRAVPSWSLEILLYKIPLYAIFVASLFIFGIIRREEVNRVRGYLAIRFAVLGVK